MKPFKPAPGTFAKLHSGLVEWLRKVYIILLFLDILYVFTFNHLIKSLIFLPIPLLETLSPHAPSLPRIVLLYSPSHLGLNLSMP